MIVLSISSASSLLGIPCQSTMSFRDFNGFSQIEQQLTAENLIAVPAPPSPTSIEFHGDPDHGLLSPVVHREILTSKPQSILQAIYNIFKTTQVGAAAWNTHPAILMVVGWIKKNLTEPRWEDQNLNNVVFDSIESSPDQFNIGGIDTDRLKRGGMALLVKAIYNNLTKYDDNIQLDKCNQEISSLNSYVWDHQIDFLIMWYRHNFDIWPTDNKYVDAYRAVLCSKAYKTLKQSQAGNGTWLDANLEMFHHFVKLAACGATDDQINDIYHELTTEIPILDGSTFSEIYTNHWRTYQAWVAKGYLDFGDLGASNLDKWYAYPVNFHGQTPEIDYLALDIINTYDYWKPTPSSSCFSGSTPVLMASGESKCISEVKPGDRILSPALSAKDTCQYRIVAFVGKPKRAGRRLYELQDFPGILFTETHPLVAMTAGRHIRNVPTLQFVDRFLAASLNPTWQSFETTDIEARRLVSCEAEAENERLYDLVFEPVATAANSTAGHFPAYTLVASNSHQLHVLSEAPLMAWFPLEMVFVGNCLQAISSSKLGFAAAIDKIDKNEDSLQGFLRTLADTDVSQHSARAITDVNLGSLLLQQEEENVQSASDLVEKLIMRLGRAMGKEIYTGWLNASTVASAKTDVVDVFFIHVLHRLSDDPDGANKTIPSTWLLKIEMENSLVINTAFDGHIQGHNIVVLHKGIALPALDVTSGTRPKQLTRFLKIELEDRAGEMTWIGGGPLQYGLQSILSVGDVSAQGTGNHAALEVELRKVSRERFERRRSWEQQERVTYAATLGFAFGLELTRV
ncbi:hypothetical protein HJFPF1_10361 [Paramyrothecium foliicola]|nr:hypothetical protein HJFPF1_10361 [Paramyrothecium foliicola]